MAIFQTIFIKDSKGARIRRGREVPELKKALDGVTNLKKAMGKVARTLDQFVRSTFRTQTDPWGDPWKPLAESTLAARRAQGISSEQILILSGDLYASIRNDHGETYARVEVGEGLPFPYDKVHQWGISDHRPWGGAPRELAARAFLPSRFSGDASFPDEWMTSVYAPVNDLLKEATKPA